MLTDQDIDIMAKIEIKKYRLCFLKKEDVTLAYRGDNFIGEWRGQKGEILGDKYNKITLFEWKQKIRNL